MAAVVFFGFVFAIGVTYFRGKYTLGLLLAYSLLSTYISIFGHRVDSLYLILPILYFFSFIKLRRCKLIIGKPFLRYYFLIFIVYLIYIISWIFFNRNNSQDLIPLYFGAFKWIAYIQVCYQMNYDMDEFALFDEIYKFICIVSIFNVIFVSIQRAIPFTGLYFIQNMQNDATYEYAIHRDSFRNGSFRRCFGAMNYPMTMGMFSTLAIAFLVLQKKKRSVTIFLVVANVITGVFSASKSFYMGVLFLIVLSAITAIYFLNGNVKKTLTILCMSIVVILIGLLNFDNIYDFLLKHIGANYARYWALLKNFTEVFAGRYSDDAKDLSYMPEFLKDYWFLGAGPVSLTDEAIMDSAIFVLLHGGGIVVFAIVFIYYIKILIHLFAQKELYGFTLLSIVFVLGSGFNTWISSEISMWVIFLVLYVLLIKEKDTNVRNEENLIIHRQHA